MISLWVAGKPRGKDRPRHRPGGRPFTPKETVNAEAQIVQVWREQGEPRMNDGPLSLFVRINVERPQSHFKKSGDLSAEGLRRYRPDNKKPDVDNCLKLVMDALNGRAYKDDVQIVVATVIRLWGEVPGIEILVMDFD